MLLCWLSLRLWWPSLSLSLALSRFLNFTRSWICVPLTQPAPLGSTGGVIPVGLDWVAVIHLYTVLYIVGTTMIRLSRLPKRFGQCRSIHPFPSVGPSCVFQSDPEQEISIPIQTVQGPLLLFAVDHHQVSIFTLTVFPAFLPSLLLSGEEITSGVNLTPICRTLLGGHTTTWHWRMKSTNSASQIRLWGIEWGAVNTNKTLNLTINVIWSQ